MRYSRSTAASLASLCGARLPRRPLCTRQPLIYSDAFITDVLADVKTVAIVGASTSWKRPSFFVMKYLQQKGYTVYPVNPRAVGETILGEEVYATLADLPETVDMVDVFRGGDAAAGVTDEAIAHGAKVVWMQLGVSNEAAAKTAHDGGLEVVMNRCMKIEYARLFGGLSLIGVNTKVISGKRPMSITR